MNIPTWRGANVDFSGMASLLKAMPNPAQNLGNGLANAFQSYQDNQMAERDADIKEQLNLSKQGLNEQKTQAAAFKNLMAPTEFGMKEEKHQSDLANQASTRGRHDVQNAKDIQGMDIKAQEQQTAQAAAQLDARLQANNINLGELSHEDRQGLYQQAIDAAGPEAVNASSLGTFFKEEQKSFHEGQKAYNKQSGKDQAEMDLYLGGANSSSIFGSSSSAPRSSDQPPLGPEQVQALQQMGGDLVFMRKPDGTYGRVPKKKFGNAIPKNETQALERLVADPKLGNALGLSPQTRGWFESMNPMKWSGSNREGALSTGAKNLPESDQQMLGKVTKLMQMTANPNDVLGLVQKAMGMDGKPDKKEINRILDLELHKINSELYGYAHQIKPNT